MKKHKSKMSAQETVDYIKGALGYKSYAKPMEHWLDTGSPYLNKVLGSKKLGLCYGKVILIAGVESSGKSALAAKLVGLGQKDGADIAWVDGENSYDPRHVKHQGVDPNNVALFVPEYGEFGYTHKKIKRVVKEDVEAAEDLFDRVSIWMKLRRKQNPDGKLIVVIDSTNSFAPTEVIAAGLTEQNMRTKSAASVFWGTLLQSWTPLALHTNAIVIFIAQLRTDPSKMFGEKEYVSGGKALKYYPSVIVWMRRISNGEIIRHGRQVGVKGIVSNRKNKAGGGSIERKKCGYKCPFFKDDWKFMDADELKKEK